MSCTAFSCTFLSEDACSRWNGRGSTTANSNTRFRCTVEQPSSNLRYPLRIRLREGALHDLLKGPPLDAPVPADGGLAEQSLLQAVHSLRVVLDGTTEDATHQLEGTVQFSTRAYELVLVHVAVQPADVLRAPGDLAAADVLQPRDLLHCLTDVPAKLGAHLPEGVLRLAQSLQLARMLLDAVTEAPVARSEAGDLHREPRSRHDEVRVGEQEEATREEQGTGDPSQNAQRWEYVHEEADDKHERREGVEHVV
mmetsp:Transcript_132732/g.424678  ORF Transcript_132732/g.424678 Transcript_132732/m.424678 type:complete len:253 (-) Transcript_132732:643-1401(-)